MIKARRSAFMVASLLLLAGCSGRQDATPNGAPVVSNNAAVFDPTSGAVPLPNILATAAAPDPLAGRAPGAPMSPAEAMAYINLHEVGGTNAVAGVNAPIYLEFTYPLDPATVNAANIKVFLLTPDPAGTENNPLGFTDISGMFSYQYPAGGTDLWLFPDFPLTPGQRYLYVVTNRVLDAATEAPIIPSVYFQYLQSPTLPGGAAAGLDPIWADFTGEGGILLSGYGKVMSDLIAAAPTTKVSARTDIALMGRFITSGAGFIEASPAGPLLPVDAALRGFAAGQLFGGIGPGWNNTITVTGQISGPYLEGLWEQVSGQSAVPVSAAIGSIVTGTINSGQLSMDPVVVATSPGTLNLDTATKTVGQTTFPAYDDPAGVLQPFRDSNGVLGGFYYTDVAIPFLYMVPATPAPQGGYPLVIFQHGVTSQKETVILLGQALNGAGFAVLAIDLPLHGALAQTGNTTGLSWGEAFLALGAPLALRTNIQQAAFDLHRLELSVTLGGFATGLHAANLDALAPSRSDYHFVGHSLGSMVGAYYLAGNTTLATSGLPYTQASLDGDMKGYLSVPGARTLYLLHDSPAFSSIINGGLAQVGVLPGTTAFNEFYQVTQTVVDTVDPASLTTPLAAGLPSRFSGRLLIQEATSTTFDAQGNPTDGDLTITNPYTRYFGNALGGEAVLGTAAAAAVAPGFFQLAYKTGDDPDPIPGLFMYSLSGASPVPKTEAAAYAPGAAGPGEGYFQFNQGGIGHSSILSDPVNGPAIQKQMVYFFGVTGTSIAIDPYAF